MGKSKYVDHPRYGRSPRLSGVVPRDPQPGYRVQRSRVAGIPGTAVEADLTQQSPCPVPVLYYFDIARDCETCGRPFLFFAEEQQHWFETLGFSLDAQCLRCVECRKVEQGIARSRRRYEALLHAERSDAEDMELALCLLDLIEAGTFHQRQTERVRMLIRRLERQGPELASAVHGLRERVEAIEAGAAAG